MTESDNMFSDLEKTLCEGLTNLCFERTDYNTHPDIDVSCLENTTDLSKINGPAVRTYNLFKATKAFQAKQHLDSIYFETFALSLLMRIKFFANKIMGAEQHMPTEENLANLLEEKKKNDSPEFVDFVDRFLKGILRSDDEPPKRLKSIEFKNGTELMNLCTELPEEWTVIQLCKQVNTEVFLQTRQETLRHPSPIFLTLFRYPMSERFDHRPIKIALNQTDLDKLYTSAHDISSRMNSEGSYHFAANLKNEEFEEQTVNKMKKLLGPWIVCFCGKSRAGEKQTIADVDHFLKGSPHTFSKRQIMLICLIARRIDMLSKELMDLGALTISKTKYEWFDLMDFFDGLKIVCERTVHDYYPVILVVDEHIDFMYWEMCNTAQEFTRVDSMVTLLNLYSHHQHNVTDGYFNVKGKKGSAVINPDCTLPQFSDNFRPFVKLLPKSDWKCLYDKEPKFADLQQMLRESDVYVYCGHGSGLQFISSYETCQLTTNAVVFLMGCSSVAFKADSGYSMGTAANHYYHIAKSPAVIGHLNTTYVNYASMSLHVMLGRWFDKLAYVDPNIPGNAKNSKPLQGTSKLFNGHDATKWSPCLSIVIANIRRTHWLPPVFRAMICHRGLPVRLT